jgi:hypothetical protein
MTNELLPFAILIAITLWLAIKHVLAAIERERQLEIAERGESCHATIIGIQRPFALDACTRLYFDYVPRGSEQAVRACHVERRSPEALRTWLPAAGSIVTVRYLPGRPKLAVIARLISSSESAC